MTLTVTFSFDRCNPVLALDEVDDTDLSEEALFNDIFKSTCFERVALDTFASAEPGLAQVLLLPMLVRLVVSAALFLGIPDFIDSSSCDDERPAMGEIGAIVCDGIVDKRLRRVMDDVASVFEILLCDDDFNLLPTFLLLEFSSTLFIETPDRTEE
mmetsp:Transcript_5878/g.11146  ORF Transcript_5878/g.11146 Transcript_5878/m.11146 type:complete len:156 (+) Transcript_5878:354-821(+)